MRRQGHLAWVLLLATALVAGGCSAGDSAGGGGTGGFGGTGAAGGSTTGGRGGSGTGGSGSGVGGSAATGGVGGAGGSAGGSAGSGGTGGSGTGGSGPSDAGVTGGTGGSGVGMDGSVGDMPAIGCTVSLSPLAPLRWANLAAVEGSKLRVGATASGPQVPAKPMFDWRVTLNGQPVTTTVVGGDPAIVEFETESVGQYQIVVTVAGVTPACTNTAVASAQPPNNLVAVYRIRAIAPAGRGLAPLETDLPVSVGAMPHKTLELTGGQIVTFTPRDENQLALSAYFVQLRSRSSSTRIEGFVDTTGAVRPDPVFKALLDERRQIYDLLVIPAAGNRAPRLYPGLFTEQIQLQDYVIRPGTNVAGVVSRGGLPLADVKLRLRDGLQPSTIGTSSSSGRYSLLARSGRHEVRVVPAPESGLPEAVLPESAGITIAEGSSLVNLDFQYAVSLLFTDLNLTVNTPGGAPVSKPVDVLIQSVEGDLANIGGFSLGGGVLSASGNVRQLKKTDSAAKASFAKLVTGRYRVTVAPPPDLPGDLAITSEVIDLREWAATVNRTITLKARTPVQGRLTGTAPITGLKVRAEDAAEDGFRRTTIVNVGSDGAYTIAADPDRLYRVSLEPTPDRTVPRIPLIPFRAGPTAVANTQPLPRILTVKGQAMGEGKPIPGVVIQIYCLGNAPDCVAVESPDITNTLPIDETVSGSDGSYELRIPEPN